MRGLKRLFVPSTLRNVSVLMLTKVPPVTWPFLHKVLNKFWERNYSVGWYGVLCSMDPTIELGIVFAFSIFVDSKQKVFYHQKGFTWGERKESQSSMCSYSEPHAHRAQEETESPFSQRKRKVREAQ